MLYIILFIAISIGFYRDISFGDFDWLDVFLSVLVGFALTLLISTTVSLIISPYLAHEYVQVSEEVIFGVNMTSDIAGGFVLGSGAVSSKPYYYFFKQSGDGLQLSRVSAFETQLLEGDHIPKVIRYEQRFKNKLAQVLLGVDLWGTNKYTLYVPKGTIITDYNIDLGNVGR